MKQMKNILENYTKSLTEVFIEVYKQYMREKEAEGEGALVLKEIIVFSDSVKESSYKEMSDEERKVLNKIGVRYYGLLNELVSVLAKENNAENVFYERLYQSIFRSSYFPETDEERGILVFLLSRRVGLLPYYKAPSQIAISEDEFREIIERINDKIEIAMFMIRDRFSTTCEEAVQLNEISKSLNSDEEKSVFWAVILSQLKRNESNETRNEL